MNGWRSMTMADVMAEFHDGPHATPPPADEGPVFLGIKNITDAGWLDLIDVRHIAEEDFDRWTRRATPQPGDVVFTYEATLHRYALIPEGFRGCLGRRLALIRPNRSVVLPRYLHFAMLGPAWRSTVEERVISGSTVDRVPIIDFPKFPIELPDLDTQARVVEILGAIDDLIENNRRRIALLERMAQAIYREWFVYFRYPGHEDDELIDSPLGPIPADWAVAPFLELAGFLNGFAFKPAHWGEKGLPIVKIRELKQGVTPSTPRYDGEGIASKYRIGTGDLLFSWSADLEAYLWSWGPALLNQHLFKVSAADGVAKTWLYLALRERMSEFRSRSQGTTMKHIKRAALGEVSTVAPNASVMQAFDDAVTPILEELLALSAVLSPLESVRDELLPKLVTGAIDVSRLDLEELAA